VKKTGIIVLLTLLITSALLTGCGAAVPPQSSQPVSVTDAGTDSPAEASDAQAASPAPAAAETAAEVSAEDAVKIALADAGINAEAAVIKEAKLDTDDLKKHYDVEFFAGDREYDYDISLADGGILSSKAEKMDAEDYAEMKMLIGQAADSADAAQEAAAVNEEKALEIAVAHAGVAMSEISRQSVRLEYDDDTGRKNFEVEFHVGKMEYDYEIDPETGAVVKYESEIDD